MTTLEQTASCETCGTMMAGTHLSSTCNRPDCTLRVHTSAEARRRPLVQYVILRTPALKGGDVYLVQRSAAGSKPSHWMIHPPVEVGAAFKLEQARTHIPDGFKRMDRRKDDRVDVVEVWV